MVRRPVHPAALRALVVHALYRGPEKRRSARVNVGAPVRMKIGWRPRAALLVDLSVSGCRLITDRAIDPGASFRLLMPAALAGGKALAIEARVVDCSPSRDAALGRFVTSAAFEGVDARASAHLHAAVSAHTEGPAVWHGAPSTAPVPTVTHAAIDRDACAAAPGRPPAAASLDDEAARVLMGRDLSRGGMRIDPNPRLAVGMSLRLAVHAETRDQPLILNAVVDRDDGERGLVLRFRDQPPRSGSA